jgi:hypothetical protein
VERNGFSKGTAVHEEQPIDKDWQK